jgi:hypothetical protein
MKYLFALLVVLGFASSADAQIIVQYNTPVVRYGYGYNPYGYNYYVPRVYRPYGYYRRPVYGYGPVFLDYRQVYQVPGFGW